MGMVKTTKVFSRKLAVNFQSSTTVLTLKSTKLIRSIFKIECVYDFTFKNLLLFLFSFLCFLSFFFFFRKKLFFCKKTKQPFCPSQQNVCCVLKLTSQERSTFHIT